MYRIKIDYLRGIFIYIFSYRQITLLIQTLHNSRYILGSKFTPDFVLVQLVPNLMPDITFKYNNNDIQGSQNILSRLKMPRRKNNSNL